jgi:hypothetical protein
MGCPVLLTEAGNLLLLHDTGVSLLTETGHRKIADISFGRQGADFSTQTPPLSNKFMSWVMTSRGVIRYSHTFGTYRQLRLPS